MDSYMTLLQQQQQQQHGKLTVDSVVPAQQEPLDDFDILEGSDEEALTNMVAMGKLDTLMLVSKIGGLKDHNYDLSKEVHKIRLQRNMIQEELGYVRMTIENDQEARTDTRIFMKELMDQNRELRKLCNSIRKENINILREHIEDISCAISSSSECGDAYKKMKEANKKLCSARVLVHSLKAELEALKEAKTELCSASSVLVHSLKAELEALRSKLNAEKDTE